MTIGDLEYVRFNEEETIWLCQHTKDGVAKIREATLKEYELAEQHKLYPPS